MKTYLDTSAAFKLCVPEVGSDALARAVTQRVDTDGLVASKLLETELHCALARRRGLAPGDVKDVLDTVALVDLAREDLARAATAGWGLRALDTIHLATAVRLEVEEIITYDQELAEVADRIGIRIISPE